MVSLPSPMHRRLALVDDEGDGAMCNKVNENDNGAMGNNVNDDGKGVTYDDIDNDCDNA